MNIPVGFAQVNMVWSGAALLRGAQTVFGVDNNVVDSAPEDIATLVVGCWDNAGSFREQQDNDVILESVRVKFGPNATGPDGEVSVNLAGEFNTTGVSAQVALLVSKRAAVGGRSNKGRMFIPGLAELAVEASGAIVTAALGNWQTCMDEFLDNLAAVDIPMVILHNAVEQAPTPVTSLQVESLAATQRRRIRRVGGRRRSL